MCLSAFQLAVESHYVFVCYQSMWPSEGLGISHPMVNCQSSRHTDERLSATNDRERHECHLCWWSWPSNEDRSKISENIYMNYGQYMSPESMQHGEVYSAKWYMYSSLWMRPTVVRSDKWCLDKVVLFTSLNYKLTCICLLGGCVSEEVFAFGGFSQHYS